jgi:membrane-associated protease RseP (regulator of RpoE activity)
MFDFAIAGPLAGMVVSIFLLYTGLSITASMDMAEQSQLPALPVLLLHVSALGGGLIESFLGSGVLTTATPETSVLPLHPLAIGGYIGLISNALSLLPVGSKLTLPLWYVFDSTLLAQRCPFDIQ